MAPSSPGDVPRLLRNITAVFVALALLRLAVSEGGREIDALLLAQVVVFAACAAWLALGAARGTPVARAAAGVLAAVMISTVWSIRWDSSLREVLHWSLYFGILLLTSSTLTGKMAARRFTDGLLVVGGALVLFGLYLFWGTGDPKMRWYSTFYAPNGFAAFLLLLLPLAAARYTLARSRREAFDYGALTVGLATAFVLTFSRGAYVALVLIGLPAGLAFRASVWQSVIRRTVFAVVLTALAVTFLTHSPARIASRTAALFESGNSSVQDRLSFWRSGVSIWRDRPLAGAGAGTFAYAHARYQGRYYAVDAHNLYVQTLAEMGVIGLAALLAFLTSLVALWLRALRSARGTEEYGLIVGIGLSLAAFFLHSGVEMSWQFPVNPAIAFALVGVLAWYDTREAGRPAWSEPGRRVRALRVVGAAGFAIALVAAVMLHAADREFNEGRRLARGGEWSEASQRFERAMTLNPLDPKAPSARASALQRLSRDSEDLVGLIDRSAALDRMNAYYPLQRAEVLWPRREQHGVGQDVERLFRDALDLDPFHYPEAYRRLAQLYTQQRRWSDADATYARADAVYATRAVAGDPVLRFRLWPRVAALYAEWAVFRADQRSVDEAVTVLDRLLRQDPAWFPAYVQIADLYGRAGRAREAAAAIAAGWAEMPDSHGVALRTSRLTVAYPGAYPR